MRISIKSTVLIFSSRLLSFWFCFLVFWCSFTVDLLLFWLRLDVPFTVCPVGPDFVVNFSCVNTIVKDNCTMVQRSSMPSSIINAMGPQTFHKHRCNTTGHERFINSTNRMSRSVMKAKKWGRPTAIQRKNEPVMAGTDCTMLHVNSLS